MSQPRRPRQDDYVYPDEEELYHLPPEREDDSGCGGPAVGCLIWVLIIMGLIIVCSGGGLAAL